MSLKSFKMPSEFCLFVEEFCVAWVMKVLSRCAPRGGETGLNGCLHSAEGEGNMQGSHGKNWAEQGGQEWPCPWPVSWSTLTIKTLLM